MKFILKSVFCNFFIDQEYISSSRIPTTSYEDYHQEVLIVINFLLRLKQIEFYKILLSTKLIQSDLIRSVEFPTIIFKKLKLMQRRHWTGKEDEVLALLVGDIGLNNWTLVSMRLSQRCQGSMRSGKQCRERWFNHLDVNINKHAWSQKEELTIFQLHQIYGNKWKEIAKQLKNRTQNDIKNHFYATLRKGIRRMNKFIGFKKNPTLIRAVKPNVLSELCAEEQKIKSTSTSEKNLTGILELIFNFSREKPNQESLEKMASSPDCIERIDKTLQKILTRNLEYEELKKKKASEEKVKRMEKKLSIGISQSEKENFDISEYLCFGNQKESEFKSQGYSSPKSLSSSSVYHGESSSSNQCIFHQ